MRRAISALQSLIDDYYSSATGQFQGLCWKTALALDSLGELLLLLPSNAPEQAPVREILNNTFALIPNRDAAVPPCNGLQIMDDNFDDQGWWALAWLTMAEVFCNPYDPDFSVSIL